MNNGHMIEVRDLTKTYSGHPAVSRLTFTVGRGEIVGLLGPNGAGKSTTMRILACFLSANSGTARVAGYDVFTQADEVRRRIGYMPENNPLYSEMRVCEYLKFRARLKGLGLRRTRERVGVVVEQCGLSEVYRKIIGHLSKGYRQRVGLADALIHEPDLLILDEPTIGLDPNQIRAVRQMIQELAVEHTILISTHILPEVEVTCHRVLIMHRGKILAVDTPGNLQRIFSDGALVVAEISAPMGDLRSCWESLPEIEGFDLTPADEAFVRCTFTPRVGTDIRALVYDHARNRGWTLRELRRHEQTLEDIFVQMTRPKGEEED